MLTEFFIGIGLLSATVLICVKALRRKPATVQRKKRRF